ncbi:hypothetical protein [Streptomyces sp. KAU_LT]|uniref:hypothetical protein n=1 Tax=Streptomyces sp. KAU_LT TaxID=3046669 RepID=UPI0024B6F9CB|nr:hypothetical protein [Streptomyces sp. KAU_LT]MDI9836229.1 hypothetical protein [Streptomyces sp. KAU_LT]
MAQQPQPRMTPAELVAEGIARASALGWRTISLRRLRALAAGDARQLPPLPSKGGNPHA